MEKYQGIKFTTKILAHHFEADNRLEILNKWVFIFGELGLAPVHSDGAYGNHSYRVKGNQFIITRTGMIPQKNLQASDYCLVWYDKNNETFNTQGRHEPSSECFLHHHIYSSFPNVNVIMHGHSKLLNTYAEKLNIPETENEFPYGTAELAQAAIDLLMQESDYTNFFILKNHGFVCLGDKIEMTAATILAYYNKLLNVLCS